MKKYYINDTQWWYSVNGTYDLDRISDVLKFSGAKDVKFKNKFGWLNMPQVIVFSAKDEQLKSIEENFTKEFGSDYSFSRRPIW